MELPSVRTLSHIDDAEDELLITDEQDSTAANGSRFGGFVAKAVGAIAVIAVIAFAAGGTHGSQPLFHGHVQNKTNLNYKCGDIYCGTGSECCPGANGLDECVTGASVCCKNAQGRAYGCAHGEGCGEWAHPATPGVCVLDGTGCGRTKCAPGTKCCKGKNSEDLCISSGDQCCTDSAGLTFPCAAGLSCNRNDCR